MCASLDCVTTWFMQMEKEIKELIQQRDLAQSRLEDLLQVVGDGHSSRQLVPILVEIIEVNTIIYVSLTFILSCSVSGGIPQPSFNVSSVQSL